MRILLSLSVIAAHPYSAAAAGDVADKCGEAVASMEIPDAADRCSCFEAALSDDEKSVYMAMDVATWAESASDSMKEAAATCFPDNNTN